MFDDYKFKKTPQRVEMRFVQQADEPMYPWEIAGFLNHLNTSYYKYELLNSVCSAINSGISPNDIFIFDKSLPLYQRYSSLNLLTEDLATKIFYEIGEPYPLFPNRKGYEYKLIFKAFRAVNSFLYAHHVKTLPISLLSEVNKTFKNDGLAASEKKIVDFAYEQATKSYEAAKKKKKDVERVTKTAIKQCLRDYNSYKSELFSDLRALQNIGEANFADLLKSNKRDDRRRGKIADAFFYHFRETTRPLVFARVGDDKIRVLGRSLVNKKEQVGLELKEAVRRSPLNALLEGGLTLAQLITSIAGSKRANEMHQLNVEEKKIDIQIKKEQLAGHRLDNIKRGLEIEEKINTALQGSDSNALNDVKNMYMQSQLRKTYIYEQQNTDTLLTSRGLKLDENSVRLIDTKV